MSRPPSKNQTTPLPMPDPEPSFRGFVFPCSLKSMRTLVLAMKRPLPTSRAPSGDNASQSYSEAKGENGKQRIRASSAHHPR